MYNSQKKRKALLNRAFRLERRFFRCQTEKHEKNEIEVNERKIDVLSVSIYIISSFLIFRKGGVELF